MKIQSLAISDVKLITPDRFGDQRGYFEQTYHQRDYAAAGINTGFVQDNFSRSRKDVLRGMHYQLKAPQAKLVTIFYGSVYDVVIDLRHSSPTFGSWLGVELSAQSGTQLFVPRGFAHGFLVTSDTVGFHYKCDAFYDASDEHSIAWDDPDVKVDWPLQNAPSLSAKDSAAPKLRTLTEQQYFA
ncbi:MAG: dTDP-4-dehydrorhamnose 3,5-epimerase [Gammaproteobacteria bacterium]|nr:dTDP-4-dehydrorhamnose 3,5-epimerase [Gammaproteobacteria bacterium]MBT8150827.1 dTDP-4-dehydrorhamnose 3,5-epimerase [Gammaproteobacteria bacterium]NNM11747.1 dTDP-4-dehydrorhamnose 3,5-epimerase [Pseudomonadales bacterium]RZV52693.1 MAG: dTDP-4-dehydrorhamnose 3,5-epimerase [Pseudomonadales bacterium]